MKKRNILFSTKPLTVFSDNFSFLSSDFRLLSVFSVHFCLGSSAGGQELGLGEVKHEQGGTWQVRVEPNEACAARSVMRGSGLTIATAGMTGMFSLAPDPSCHRQIPRAWQRLNETG